MRVIFGMNEMILSELSCRGERRRRRGKYTRNKNLSFGRPRKRENLRRRAKNRIGKSMCYTDVLYLCMTLGCVTKKVTIN